MIKISQAQFDALSLAWKAAQCDALAKRLRGEMPDGLAALSEVDLNKQVRVACEASETQGIEDIDDVYRFVRLFFIPASVWQRPGALELLVQVLKDTGSPVKQRLKFIEERILAAALPPSQ